MIFRYGNFAFADGEARPLSFRTEGKRGQRVVLEQITKTISIEFEFLRDSQLLLTQRWNQIDTAISADGYDAGFYHSASQGGGRSAIFLDSSSSTSGVWISEYPSMGSLEGGDYANSLKGTCAFSAIYEPGIIGGGGGGGGGFGEQLTQYSEGLSFNGTGGPRIVWVENDRGLPERYQLTDHTVCSCEQQGSCTSLDENVAPNPPAYPNLEIFEARKISNVVEVRSGTGDVQYQVSWSYLFQNSGPFSGSPRVR